VTETPPIRLDTDTVLVRPVRTRVRKFKGRTLVAGATAGFELDEVGAFIFTKLNGRTSIAEIGAAIAAEYQVAPEEATADAIELLQELVDNGLIKPA
jgi:hypothetical protein